MDEERAQQWRTYNDKQAERRVVRPLLAEAAALAGAGGGRIALELGCGAGIETVELARSGWQVTAIDDAPGTIERVEAVIAERAPHLRHAIQFHKGDLESPDVEFPAADLIYSGYTLPYLHPAVFPRVWTRMLEMLRPEGHLAVQLFGDRDSYVGEPGWNFHTRAEVDRLLQRLDLLSCREEDEDGMAARGPKHWHVFHIIARRPAASAQSA